ncbi:molecular chaperone [Pantoea coffeiphila]|uniref:fimbrial biogenesis chaperone n=1 Tax=Pantoea coffeiphila TaxID=1465635 RepID=UPI00195FDF37|nr:molecular chaperone [Pantoea coffeiphila]MBM7344119.1 fimbrial chaperone protein [Pantoea coffeiphila]
MKLKTGLLFCALWLTALCPQFALAASSVLVWPVYQVIEADQQGSALWLENRGSYPVSLQVRVLGWQQQDQRDRYADQQDVIASPPFATVEPGKRQLIRLMRTVTVPAGREQSYRIVIDELPGSLPKEMQEHAGLQLQMRYLLPLFLDGEGLWTQERTDRKRDASTATRPQLSWTLSQREGKTWLTVRNQGVVHARLSNVFWGSSNKPEQASLRLSEGFLGYVLPGQKMSFPLPAKRQPSGGQTLYAQLADNTTPVAIQAAN